MMIFKMLLSNALGATLMLGIVYTEGNDSSGNQNQPAFIFYQRLVKSRFFKVSKDFVSQRPILNSHFVDYVRRDGRDADSGSDGILSFVVVGSGGVYRKRLDAPWEMFDVAKDDNDTLMEALWESGGGDNGYEVTAAQMYGNESILTIAHRNLSVWTIDVRKSSNQSIVVISSFDASYKYGNEEGDRIRSIGRIPYSDEILVQANRFELIKADFRKNIVNRYRAPLDSVRHIVCPVPTGDTQNDPHSPNRKKKTTISERMYRIGEQTRCVLTGHESPMNTLLDWTTMKPVTSWSHYLIAPVNLKEKTTIHSICFFGGIPEANLYIYTVPTFTHTAHIYEAIHGSAYSTLQLNIRARNQEVTWVNQTLFILIKSPSQSKEANVQTEIYFHKIYGQGREHVDLNSYRTWSFQRILNWGISKVYLNGGKGSSDVLFDYENDLDSIYVSYALSLQGLGVLPPPFGWDFCRYPSLTGGQNMTVFDAFLPLRTYGRFKMCPECAPGLMVLAKQTEITQQFANELITNKTIIYCQRVGCPDKGMIPHSWYELNSSLVLFKRLKSPFPVEEKVECLPRYSLEDEEKVFANDNGCQPGFNLDVFGICRACGISNASDCLFFNHRFFYDYFTLNVLNYTEDKLGVQYAYKGHKEGHLVLPFAGGVS